MLASPTPVDNSEDETKRFFVVFISEFCLCLINLLYASIGICYFMYASPKMLTAASSLVALSGILTLAWMIYASIVIFSDEGQLCKDTYAPKSGQFIYVWLILVYICFGLLFCIACMLACII